MHEIAGWEHLGVEEHGFQLGKCLDFPQRVFCIFVFSTNNGFSDREGRDSEYLKPNNSCYGCEFLVHIAFLCMNRYSILLLMVFILPSS